jgi:hypothetical protein
MDVRVVFFDGCPHWTLAEDRLHVALSRLGRDTDEITRVVVKTPDDAENLGFIGSPTVLVDGKDPFATGSEPVAMACRLFNTPEGPAGSPTVDQLMEVLS